MLSCKALAQQHASDYLDNMLTPRQRFSVHLHLMLCRNCRRFVAQLRVVQGVLQRSPPITYQTTDENTDENTDGTTDETTMRNIAAKLHKDYDEQKKS